ncbi:MAG TPA: divalent-cation tolerance protein CutA [Patescibacteria group bacterium]
MTDMLLVYITCNDVQQAKSIGKHLMDKKLCACVNIFPEMQPMFFWPPKSGTIDESKEVVLIAKTIESKYEALENEVHQVHSYEVPCVFAIPVKHVASKYYDWLVGEMES